MLDIIILGLVFYFGYQIGQIVLSWQLRDLVIKEAKREGIIDDNLNIIEDKPSKPNVYKLVIEKVKDTLYLYDHEDEFVCQALTVEELATLAKKYKNIKYAAVLYGEETYMFVDGVVKTKL